jgi:DNA-binding NtrC family response regulator
VLRELGGWDEDMVTNQDYEFDYRVRASGRELLFDPAMRIDWRCPATIKGFFRQYRRYGRGKVNTLVRHPESGAVRHYGVEFRKPVLGISPEVEARLVEYDWPGNVRELRAIVRRSLLMSDGEIKPDDLGINLQRSTQQSSMKSDSPGSVNRGSGLDPIQNLCLDGSSLKEITQLNIDEIERIVILDTLKKTGNNKAEAARRLNIDYKTLYSKLKKINSTLGK